MNILKRFITSALLPMVFTTPSVALDVKIAFLSTEREAVAVLSNLDPIPEDIGAAGFELGIKDNATTGRFMGQNYISEHHIIELDADPTKIFEDVLSESQLIVTDLPRDMLLQLSTHKAAENALIFNAYDQSIDLRDVSCRSNVFHTIPSFAMRADALAQTLAKKRWTNTALIYGTFDEDIAFAEALRGSLKKFGVRLRDEKQWFANADIRRTASSEIPIFTQDLKSHDVLLIADETDDFGRYVAYNTWKPVLIAGSHGLRPVGWDRTAEQWGAAQLQSRFNDLAERAMQTRDYAAWAAVRAIGEAVTRTKTNDIMSLRDYLLSDSFELAGFKGRPLSFRTWNGQLRQPIPVVGAKAVVANAPLEGFLHQSNEMDSLGLDKKETNCTAFGN